MNALKKMNPVLSVNPQLNHIVSCCLADYMDTITGIKFEYTSEGVPENGKQIHAMWVRAKEHEGTFKVFNGANDARNLYFSPHVNLMYRAVHDLDHAKAYELGRGTTKYEDELYLNCLMAKRVYDYALDHFTQAQALAAFFAMYHDTVGQVKYYKERGDFCADQRSNTVALLNECKGYAAVNRCALGVARQVMLGYLNECGL